MVISNFVIRTIRDFKSVSGIMHMDKLHRVGDRAYARLKSESGLFKHYRPLCSRNENNRKWAHTKNKGDKAYTKLEYLGTNENKQNLNLTAPKPLENLKIDSCSRAIFLIGFNKVCKVSPKCA